MKFFAFIMSFYLLALSCYPCGDSKECNAKPEAKISASAQHPQQKHQSEACTPFCNCACCTASAFFQPSIQDKTHALAFQSLKFQYKVEFNSYDFHSIWQPPQL